MAAQGLGAGLSAFAEAFNTVRDNDPEYKMRQRAEAELAFNNSTLGKELAAQNLQRTAAAEAARYKVDTGRLTEGIVSYYSDPEQQEAVRTYLNTQDRYGVNRFNQETVENKDHTGLIKLDPDVVNMKTYDPYVKGDLKRVGESNFFYHSAKSRKGKVAAAGDTFTSNFYGLEREFRKERGLTDDAILELKDKRKLHDAAFKMLDINQQTLFNQQSTNFNSAINNVIRTYKGSLIVSDKSFTRAITRYRDEVEIAKQINEHEGRLAQQKLNVALKVHKQRQEKGYGYKEEQYRSVLREMLSRHVGGLGLTDAAQIEDFMTQFLEDERNQARLLTRMVRKYGAPKTDTVAGADSPEKTKAADPNRREIRQLKKHLGP